MENNLISRDRFLRIGPARTQLVLDALRKLENCSNAANYHYTEVEVEQIFAAITDMVDEVKKSFQLTHKPKKDKFVLVPDEAAAEVGAFNKEIKEEIVMQFSTTAIQVSDKRRRGRPRKAA